MTGGGRQGAAVAICAGMFERVPLEVGALFDLEPLEGGGRLRGGTPLLLRASLKTQHQSPQPNAKN